MTNIPGVPDNKNFLSPLSFIFNLKRAPTMTYFCQGASLPSMISGEILTDNPFSKIPHTPTKISFEPLDIRFAVDEDMKNYTEIYNWLIGITFPDNFEQHRTYPLNNANNSISTRSSSRNYTSDASLLIYTSHHNPNIRINFQDLFPVSLNSLEFDTRNPDIEYLEATVSFRYRRFELELLNNA
jgi:hypothetical protein